MLEEIMFIAVIIMLGAYLIYCLRAEKEDEEEWFSDEKRKWWKIRTLIRTIIFLIWIIDILNINFLVNGVEVATYLDTTIPLNILAWILILVFVLPNEIGSDK